MADDMRLEYFVDADTSGTIELTRAVDKAEREVVGSFNNMDKSVKQLGTQTTVAAREVNKGMSSMRGAIGNVGFQLQDIAVQAQMGTNAFVILGQQGSQIAGAFGPGGAVIGAFIAIGAAILHVATSLDESSEAFERFQESVSNMSDEDLAKLTGTSQAQALDEFTTKLKEQEKQYESGEQKLSDLIAQYAEYDRQLEAIDRTTERGMAQYAATQRAQEDLTKEINTQEKALGQLATEAQKTSVSVSILSGETKVLTEEQKQANEAIASTITNLQTQAAVIGMTAKGAALYRLELMGATEEQKQAAAAALDLIQAEKDRQAAEKASIQVSRQRSKQQKQSEKDMDSLNKKLEKLTNERLLLESKQKEANRTLDPYQQELDKYKAKMQALEDYKNSEFYVEQRYRDMALQAETQHQESIRALQEETFRNMSGGNALLLDTFNSLENAATNVFSGMLSGTMSATDAMKAFGNAILNEAIGALVKMGVEQLKQAVIGKSMQAASTAAAVAQGAAIAAAMQPAAMAASIATSGAAAAAGMSGYTSAMASAMIPVAGGRLYGGPTQAGKMYRVNENGRPEFFQTSSGQSYMMSGQAGHVTPASDSGGNSINIVQNFNVDASATYDQKAMSQLMQATKAQTMEVLQQQMRQGGMLSR